MNRLRIDFETASAVDLRVAGAHRYAEDPTTEVVSLSFRFRGPDEAAYPCLWLPALGEDQDSHYELMQAAGLNDIIFVAHNAGFEKAIWRNIMVPQYGFPDIPNKRWHCTQAACAMRVVPQDLDRALRVLRLPFQKDKEGSALAKALSKPNKRTGRYDRSEETLARIYEYNRHDIRGTEVLDDRLGDLPPKERQVWLLDQRINERGVRLDLPLVRACQQVVDLGSAPLIREFAEITGGLKPSQGAKFMAWLVAQGATLPNLQKDTLARVLGDSVDEDEADADDDEAETIELPDNAARALHIRQLTGSASIKKLVRMEQCVCGDGRARGLIQYHGAGPGLWAGRLFQPQNFPRGTLEVDGIPPDPSAAVAILMSGDPDYVAATLGPPVESVVHCLRHILIPAEGHLFVSADLSGIQARTVLALSGQYDKAEVMGAGQDVYLDMAMAIYRRPLVKTDKAERQMGKGAVLGLGFGMGAKKFRAKMAQNQTLDFCQDVVDVYRKEWAPRVPQLWRGLEGAAVRAVHDRRPQEAFGILYQLEDGWLTARLPSGRKIWYFNPTPCRRAMPWDENDIRLAWTYNAMKMGQWKTIDAFGGLLTENVVMGIQRDLMTAAMFKCEREGLPIVLNVHDEIVCEVPEARADLKTLIDIMTDSPEWAKQLQIPVAAEGWVGDRYHK